MTRRWAVAIALAAALVACGGARKEARGPSPSDRSAERERVHRSEGEVAGSPDRSNGPRVPASPGTLLGPDTVAKAQQALAQRGLLAQHRQGELDTPTSAAVRRFQEQQGLAATGMPDKETLRKLGVSAEEGYGSGQGTGSRQEGQGSHERGEGRSEAP